MTNKLHDLLFKAETAAARLARMDSDFKESDHPRDNDGKFTSGSGGGVDAPAGYTLAGKADLKAQGLTPMRRTGSNPTATEAARVAWATAQQLGTPQTICPTHLGWAMLKKGEGLPTGHPHMVVTAEGVVYQFKATTVETDPSEANDDPHYKAAMSSVADIKNNRNAQGATVDEPEYYQGAFHISVRDFGTWQTAPGRDREEDDDHEVPTEATVKALDALTADLSKKYGVTVSWMAEEKNYVSIRFEAKK